jgi:hypothetical protein
MLSKLSNGMVHENTDHNLIIWPDRLEVFKSHFADGNSERVYKNPASEIPFLTTRSLYRQS